MSPAASEAERCIQVNGRLSRICNSVNGSSKLDSRTALPYRLSFALTPAEAEPATLAATQIHQKTVENTALQSINLSGLQHYREDSPTRRTWSGFAPLFPSPVVGSAAVAVSLTRVIRMSSNQMAPAIATSKRRVPAETSLNCW